MLDKKAIVLLVTMLLAFGGKEGLAQTASSQVSAASTVSPADTSRWEGASIKINLAYTAAGAANLGAEFAMGDHFSTTLTLGLKSWPRWLAWDWDPEKESKWRHILVAPGVRWWPEKVFEHWFVGADLVWSHFNVAKLNFPLIYPQVRDYRLQGDVYALGLFGGYSWRLARHLRLEAEAGVGIGYYQAEKFECPHCGAPLGESKGLAILPKIGVNLSWDFMAHEKQKREKLKKEIVEQLSVTNIN